MSTIELADTIENTSAEGVLCDRPYRSFCQGSGQLIELGLMDQDGQLTDQALEVQHCLNLRHEAQKLATSTLMSL